MAEKSFWDNLIEESTGLDPLDRISEVLYGLIMILTYMGTIRVSTDGEQQVIALLWAALGGSFAWALIDSIMYLMGAVLERGHSVRKLKEIYNSDSPEKARKIIREGIDPLIEECLGEDAIETIYEKIKKSPEPTKKTTLILKDFIIAIEIFLLMFAGTLPVALPFIFIDNVSMAIHVSNAAALLLLFTGGYFLAKYAGFKPLTTALSYTGIGIILIVITIALGG